MKKLFTLLLALVPMMSYAEHDNAWIEEVLSGLEKNMDYLADYFHAPSEDFVFAQEFGLQDTNADDDPTHRIIRDSVGYKLNDTHRAMLYAYFVYGLKAAKKAPEDCPEYSFQFSTVIRDAYNTLQEKDFTKIIKDALLMRQFESQTQSSIEDIAQVISRGGEYSMSANNNVETAHNVKLTVLADPICSFKVEPAISAGYAMHQTANFEVKIGSGYPYADRLAKYQQGEMVFTIRDAQNEVIKADTFKLDASADSVKMEFFKGRLAQDLPLESTKYTFSLSGPLLEEPIVKVIEVGAYYGALENAIHTAEQLADSIRNTPELTRFEEYAKQLSDAVMAAKPCLEYTVDRQDDIDAAANTLVQLIKTVTDAMTQTVSIDAVTVEAAKKNGVKKIVDGEIRIQADGHTFNLQGIEKK